MLSGLLKFDINTLRMYCQPPSSAFTNNLTHTFTATLYKSRISLQSQAFMFQSSISESIFYKDYSDYCCHSADEVHQVPSRSEPQEVCL